MGLQALARSEAGKEAKENTAFCFHGVPSMSLSHHLCCPQTPSLKPDSVKGLQVYGGWFLQLVSFLPYIPIHFPPFSFHQTTLSMVTAASMLLIQQSISPSPCLIYQYMLYLNRTPGPPQQTLFTWLPGHPTLLIFLLLIWRGRFLLICSKCPNATVFRPWVSDDFPLSALTRMVTVSSVNAL